MGYYDREKKLTKKQQKEHDSVATTTPVRISVYLRDRLRSASREYGGACIARQLLKALDPKMAEKYPNLPSQRR